MAFGFPAYYKKELKLSDVDAFREKLEKVIPKLPFSISKVSENEVIFKARWSVWSWGEKIYIDLTNHKNITITSKCIFPLQCIDYGKNKENVELFINKLNSNFSNPELSSATNSP